jgi:hypothetical protein
MAAQWRALPEQGPVIGRLAGAVPAIVRIAEESRDRHTYVVGATGTGKSTLLHNLIVQDLVAGHGMCLLDPHGDLFDAVLSSVPASRLDDVIVIDPYDPDWVVGLNPLCCDGESRTWQMQAAISDFFGILDHLYDLAKTGGPMFEQYLRNAMLLVMNDQNGIGTLDDVVRVFEAPDYRRRLLDVCRDPSVTDFWVRQAERATGELAMAAIAPYITSKLNQFTQNALLGPILGQSHSTVSFADVVEHGSVVLVNLSVGQLGSRDARLLGMLVLGALFRAAASRQRNLEVPRRPFYTYLDEFHYFLTDAAAETLAQGRKFGLSLIAAHQHLGQLEDHAGRFRSRLLDAVLGNAATKLLYRLGPVDADRLACWVRPNLSSEHLLTLGDHHLVACLPSARGPVSPMIVTARPSPALVGELASVRDIRSRQARYAKERSIVEQSLRARRENPDASPNH